MNLKEKPILFSLLLFLINLLLPSSSSALEISFIWKAGLQRSSFSLINRSLASWVERMQKEAELQGWSVEPSSLPHLRYGYEMAFGLEAALTSRWSQGLASGFLYFELTEKRTSVSVKKENNIYFYAHPAKATAVPLGLNLTYFLPLHKNSRIFIKGEVGLLLARYIDREANRKETDLKFVYPVYQNARANSPYVLLGLGFSFQPESATSFLLQIDYRQARTTDFKGINKAGQEGPLEFFEEYLPSLDFWQARLLVVTAEPDPELSRNRQKAVIDFSGFSIKIGMAIKF